jgi:peptidyl-prolyl cis-trans isomerase C
MNRSRILLCAVALAACQPKTAGSAGDTSLPVATVNGVPISRDFYDFYIKGITGGKSPADLTPEQRSAALDDLIRARLLAEEAAKEGLDKSGDTRYRLELSRLNVLEQAAEERYFKDRKPTEQELRAEYESELASMPKTEYHVRHILVATEPLAKKIIACWTRARSSTPLSRKNRWIPPRTTAATSAGSLPTVWCRSSPRRWR